MNRIYQGKVSSPEMSAQEEDGKDLIFYRDLARAAELTQRISVLHDQAEDELAKLAKMSRVERERMKESAELREYRALRSEQDKEWKAAMYEHHEVFHDGINYYAFALAAMTARQWCKSSKPSRNPPTSNLATASKPCAARRMA